MTCQEIDHNNDFTAKDLVVTHCSNVACTTNTTIATIATPGINDGRNPSITIGTNGYPIIATATPPSTK
jgi:hypothetical protein